MKEEDFKKKTKMMSVRVDHLKSEMNSDEKFESKFSIAVAEF